MFDVLGESGVFVLFCFPSFCFARCVGYTEEVGEYGASAIVFDCFLSKTRSFSLDSQKPCVDKDVCAWGSRWGTSALKYPSGQLCRRNKRGQPDERDLDI